MVIFQDSHAISLLCLVPLLFLVLIELAADFMGWGLHFGCLSSLPSFLLCSCHNFSSGFRNSERGVQRTRKVLVTTPTSGYVKSELYLEATLGLVKRLGISKELIRECVTVPGCCCCMPLLHDH